MLYLKNPGEIFEDCFQNASHQIGYTAHRRCILFSIIIQTNVSVKQTKRVSRAAGEDKPTVVIASDTDILILMVHVFASRLPDHDWFLQIKKNQFVNVSKIHDYIANAVAVTLPAMFVITGCDTVSYFYRKSKKAILERVLKQEVLAVELLSDLGEHTHLSEASEEKLKRIVQIFVYGMYVLIFYV